MASAGVELVAEAGIPGTLKGEVEAAGANVDRYVSFAAPGTTGSRTHTGVTLTSDHPRITLLSMIAPTPDWFVGVSGLSLLDSSGNWVASRTVDLYPWDAGTESGTGFSLNNPDGPRGVITSLRGRGQFTGQPIARLVFTRTGSVEQAPAAPAGTAASPGDGEVTLTWTAPAANSGIVGHEYRQKTTGAFGEWTAIPDSAPGGANEGSFTVTGLANGTEHTFQLRAVNDVGGGAASADIAETPVAIPAAPTGVGVTIAGGQVQLSWTAPTPAPTGNAAITDYEYRWKRTSEPDTAYAGPVATGDSSPPASVATPAVSDLAATAQWHFQLRAVNAVGAGAWSTAALLAAKPDAVQSLDAMGHERLNDLSGGIRLSWDAPVEQRRQVGHGLRRTSSGRAVRALWRATTRPARRSRPERAPT